MLKTLHIATLATACACRGPDLRPAVAEVTPQVSYERCAAAWEATPSTRCTVQWFAVTEAPSGEAVGRAAAAIVRDRGAPFRGRSSLPIGARWLRAEDVRSWLAAPTTTPLPRQLLAEAPVVLAPDLMTILPSARPPLPTLRMRPSTAAEGAVDVLLVHEVPEDGSREALQIERALGTNAPAGLFVPATAIGDDGLLVLLVPGDPAAAAETRAARAVADQAPPAPPSPMSPRGLAWQIARDAIGARNRRPALLALVTPFQQERAVDVLVIADERALVAVTPAMTAVDADAEDAGWQLERAMWRGLLPSIERRALAPALRATVTRHLGALREDPAALSLLLETCTGDEEFTRRVREENLLALDDRSASLRVTAFTFLQRRGDAVPGFDPMGPETQRRAAVRRQLRALGGAR